MVFPKNDFYKQSCKDANINKSLLADMFNEIDEQKINIHSMMLLNDGQKVFDAYAYDYDEFSKANVYSISKSFSSIAIGILCDLKIISVEDYILFFFSNEIKEYNPAYEKLQIKHLLTMTTGQEKDVFMDLTPKSPFFEMFFNVPITSEVGTVFMYNNFASFMLSAIVTKVTGKSLNDFLNEYLYKIIGIEKPHWDHVKDFSFGCTGLHVSVNDLARFGLLILNDGTWQEQEVVSKDYLTLALKGHIKEETSLLYYGYHFWISDYVMAAGMFRQYVIIDKQYNLVFVCTAREERDILYLYNRFIRKAKAKGWDYCDISIRDYTRRFTQNSKDLILKEKTEQDI